MEQKGGKRGLPRSTDLHYLLLSDTDSAVAVFTFRQTTTDSNRQQQTATGTASVSVSDIKMEGFGNIN